MRLKLPRILLRGNVNRFGFDLVQINNTFDKPWKDGYRDINYRLSDRNNNGLIGELQLQLCAVKKFTEIAGHKAYEITRALPPGSKNVKNALLEVTRYGYNKVTKSANSGCMKNINSMHGGKRKTQRRRRKAT